MLVLVFVLRPLRGSRVEQDSYRSIVEHTIYEEIKNFRKAFLQNAGAAAAAPVKDEKPAAPATVLFLSLLW